MSGNYHRPKPTKEASQPLPTEYAALHVDLANRKKMFKPMNNIENKPLLNAKSKSKL